MAATGAKNGCRWPSTYRASSHATAAAVAHCARCQLYRRSNVTRSDQLATERCTDPSLPLGQPVRSARAASAG